MNTRHRVNARINRFFFILIMIGFFLVNPSSIKAQNWQALPPYNTLWPLWSPALSPVNAVTGMPTPIVTNLAKTTVLPSQPGLTWDPAWPNPWLLYNTPSGMLYYDPLYGINLWPPRYLIDPVSGAPVPISLPAGYAALAPTAATWIQTTIPIANSTYLAAYPSFAPPSPLPLSTALLLTLGTITLPATIPALPPPATSLLSPLAILGSALLI